MLVSFLISLMLSSLLVFPSPLLFILLLVSFCILVSFFLIMFCNIPPLLIFMILLVYVGAMVIMLGYVCAVAPNLSYSTLSVLNFFVFFLIFSFLFFFLPSFYSVSVFKNDILVVSFFYSFFGSILFFFIVFYMFIVLYSASSFTQISAPLRSF